jgi:uncharacterized membrane protein YqaE (UPF0057 family)
MRIVFSLFFFVLVLSSSPVFSSVLVAPQNSGQSVSIPSHADKNDVKAKRKAVKKILREFKKSKAADDRTVLLVILCILLPPLAVYLHQNAINSKFWISLLLSLLFWLPGIIYSLLVVLGSI